MTFTNKEGILICVPFKTRSQTLLISQVLLRILLYLSSRGTSVGGHRSEEKQASTFWHMGTGLRQVPILPDLFR